MSHDSLIDNGPADVVSSELSVVEAGKANWPFMLFWATWHDLSFSVLQALELCRAFYRLSQIHLYLPGEPQNFTRYKSKTYNPEQTGIYRKYISLRL